PMGTSALRPTSLAGLCQARDPGTSTRLALYYEEGKGMEHAQLIVHAGGTRVCREALATLQTPAATETWKPLPHHVLVDAIHEEAKSRNIGVMKEEYAVQRHHNMLVGTMVL